MKKSPYDRERFFEKYSQMDRSRLGLAGAGEWESLEPLLPDFAGKRVLDLGCGYGWHCIYAAEHGAAAVTGVDLSEKMLAVAREKTTAPQVTYIRGDMAETPFPPESFDVVLSSLAIHYLPSFTDFLERVRQCLSPGGDFVFSVEHPIFTAAGPQEWYYGPDGTPLHFPVDRYFEEGRRGRTENRGGATAPDEKLLEDHEYTERKDCSMKTGLVLEGGALRTIFSSGVCDAFLNEKLPMPDYTIGVSAGIAYGVSYLSRQKRRNLQLLMHYANDRRYMGWGNFFDPRNRSYFGLKFAYDTIPNELVPFDYDTFEAYPGQVEAVVTNLQTGRAEYREVPRRDASFLLLQATCAMPVLFQPIRLDDGAPYLDGGCSDAIPWKRALAVGCDRVVVVLTRERSYRKEPEQLMPLFRRVYRKYPVFLEGLRTRAERYNQCREELFALEQEGRVLVIAPANTRGFSRTERDRQKILALWQDGFFAGRRAAEAVRDFWTRETPSAGTPE